MGTNVYAYIIPNELELIEFKLNISKRINNCNTIPELTDYLESILDMVDERYPKLHIGKRSDGWDFLFKKNDEYYNMTKKSIEDFLKKDNILIVDEYENRYSADEFWKEFGNCKAVDEEIIKLEKKHDIVTEEGLRFSPAEYFC